MGLQLSELFPSQGSRGRTHFCLFQLLEVPAVIVSWTPPCITRTSCFCHQTAPAPQPACRLEGPLNDTGPTQVIRVIYFRIFNLLKSHLQSHILPCQVTYSWLRDEDILGPLFGPRSSSCAPWPGLHLHRRYSLALGSSAQAQ